MGRRAVVDYVKTGCCPYDDTTGWVVHPNGALEFDSEAGTTIVAPGQWISFEVYGEEDE